MLGYLRPCAVLSMATHPGVPVAADMALPMQDQEGHGGAWIRTWATRATLGKQVILRGAAPCWGWWAWGRGRLLSPPCLVCDFSKRDLCTVDWASCAVCMCPVPCERPSPVPGGSAPCTHTCVDFEALPLQMLTQSKFNRNHGAGIGPGAAGARNSIQVSPWVAETQLRGPSPASRGALAGSSGETRPCRPRVDAHL